jgi:hypothetical protein
VIEKFAPVIVWTFSSIAGIYLAWNDVKMDIRELQVRIVVNETQVAEMKKANDALVIEMRHGFDSTQKSIERIYNAILDKHK